MGTNTERQFVSMRSC